MAKPRPSIVKRQREQQRREKQAAKAERRAQRKTETPEEDVINTVEPAGETGA